MAATTVRQELVKLAMDDKSNRIAKILAYYYPNLNKSDKKALFEDLMYYYRIEADFDFERLTKDIYSESDVETFKSKDYRIKSIEISNLRGIPEQDKYPFGMNFFEGNKINNAIILANNGTGKSSVFAGLEMIYAQEIGEKKLRALSPDNLSDDDYDNYLKRVQSKLKPMCKIQTNSGEFSLDNKVFPNKKYLSLFNPSNHFISDYDIYHYGQIEFADNPENHNSFHHLLASTLGLGDFIELESILSQLPDYRRTTESINLSRLQKGEEEITKNIKEWQNLIAEKTKTLDDLKTQKSKVQINLSAKKKEEQLKELINQNFTYSFNLDLYEASIKNFIKQFQQIQSEETSEKQSIEKNFLEIGINLLHDVDNCPFCKDSKKSTDDIYAQTMERLTKLKHQLVESDKLKDAYKFLGEQLSSFFRETEFFYRNIIQERSNISLFSELKSILEIENDLYVALSPHLDDNALIERVNYYSKIAYPKNDEIKGFFDLVNDNEKLFLDKYKEFVNNINQFVVLRKNELEKLFLLLTKGQTENTIEKQIAILEDEIKRLKEQLVEAPKKLDALKPQIEKAKLDSDLVNIIKNEIKEFLPKYKLISNTLVNEAFDPIHDMIVTIMQDFLRDDKNLELIVDKRESTVTIDGEPVKKSIVIANIQYTDSSTGETKTFSPSLYFNTFRYKLFCLMVSLSMALATRIKYGINLPLVMDDLFYASDFVSKHTFSKFISEVIRLFYKYTPELPLQFILFTHDDLIFRNAIDSLSKYDVSSIEIDKLCPENKMKLGQKTLIGRIFNPQDKDNLDKEPKEFENKEPFWDLLYELPHEMFN